MKNLINSVDRSSSPTNFFEVSDAVNSLASVTTSESQAYPSGAKFVIVTADAKCTIKFGTSGVTAAVLADTSDGSASILINPTSPRLFRLPEGTTHVAAFAGSSANVTFEYYS